MNIADRSYLMKKTLFYARDYVQEGLIHQWDGIEHGSSSDVWKDLAGSKDMDVIDAEFDDHALSQTAAGVMAQSTGNVDYKFIEATFHIANGSGIGTYSPLFICSFHEGFGPQKLVYIPDYGMFNYGFAGVVVDIDTPLHIATEGRSADDARWFVNGKPHCTDGKNNAWGTGATKFGCGANDSATPGNSRLKLFSIRLYSRVLTAEEVAKNYAIDKERFGI